MAGLNKVQLIGRLGKDPEIRHTANGKTVATTSLATSETYKDGHGNKQEKTEWHNLVAWGRLAEIMGEYLSKGSQIYVEGKLQTRKWEKNGEDRYTTEILVLNMIMLDTKKSEGTKPTKRREPEPAADFDDEIPF